MSDSKIEVDTIDYQAFKKELDEAEGGLDECRCPECVEIIELAIAGDWHCEVCGYQGEPTTYECACYDHHCNPTARGSGCPHGAITCPLCDDGERTDAVARLLMQWLRRAPRPPAKADPEPTGETSFGQDLRTIIQAAEESSPYEVPCPKCSTPTAPRPYICHTCDHSWLPRPVESPDGGAEKKAKPLISPAEESKNPGGAAGIDDQLGWNDEAAAKDCFCGASFTLKDTPSHHHKPDCPAYLPSTDEVAAIHEKARAQIAALTRQLDLLTKAALQGSKAIRMALKWMDTLPDGEVPEFGLDDAARDLEKPAVAHRLKQSCSFCDRLTENMLIGPQASICLACALEFVAKMSEPVGEPVACSFCGREDVGLNCTPSGSAICFSCAAHTVTLMKTQLS